VPYTARRLMGGDGISQLMLSSKMVPGATQMGLRTISVGTGSAFLVMLPTLEFGWTRTILLNYL
jgi:hypothetical protein